MSPLMEALSERLLQDPIVADVTQTKRLPSLSKSIVTKGTVWLIPGRAFRWEQGVPLKTVAIYDGQKVFLLDERTKKADRYDPKSRKVRALMLLLGMGKNSTYQGVMKNFDPVSLTTLGNEYTIEFVPQSGTMKRFLSALTITFEQTAPFPRLISWTQKDGAVVTTEFKPASSQLAFREEMFVVTESNYKW